jgi:hypothetical protein
MSITDHGQAADGTHVNNLSSFWVARMLMTTDLQDLEGTVPAKLGEGDSQSYRHSSDELIRGRPVQRSLPMRFPQKVRASELLAELDIINAQIHRIMFQVERAVARLASG